jgi:hypothetical protein
VIRSHASTGQGRPARRVFGRSRRVGDLLEEQFERALRDPVKKKRGRRHSVPGTIELK